jgi:glycosyltransferase involved in cell wall biosynthesis
MNEPIKCPDITELPLPNTAKCGWPWTIGRGSLPSKLVDSQEWPTVSIIIPSFQQGRFIEETIRSILLQGYPRIEIIVIDGGSKDNTIDVLRKYSKWISYWVSEPDNGQSDALNKGLLRATGDVLGWQNSDDIYLPNAFINLIGPLIGEEKYSLSFGNLFMIDEFGNYIREQKYTKFSKKCLIFEGLNISNQSAIWRKSLQEEVGFFEKNLTYEMDLDFFLRAAEVGNFKFINKTTACMRIHQDAKTQHEFSFRAIREGSLIRSKYFERYRMSEKFKSLMKCLCLFRRMGFYILQGDFKYIFYGMGRRITKL